MPKHEVITSRKNPLVVQLSKLSDKKARDEEGLFRLDGIKLFNEAIKSGLKLEYIFASEKQLEKLSEEIFSTEARVFQVTDEVLERMTDEKAPQGLIAVARSFDTLPLPTEIPKDFRALLLSSIRDPGNLGTIIRTAYAFGVDRVFISPDCADIYSPKTIRAAMGTIFRQSITISDELTAISRLRELGCEVYAAALGRDSRVLGKFELPSRVCFAVGNEGHGLSDEVIEASSGSVIIPMVEGCESLNAAGAAGILAWESLKARL